MAAINLSTSLKKFSTNSKINKQVKTISANSRNKNGPANKENKHTKTKN